MAFQLRETDSDIDSNYAPSILSAKSATEVTQRVSNLNITSMTEENDPDADIACPSLDNSKTAETTPILAQMDGPLASSSGTQPGLPLSITQPGSIAQSPSQQNHAPPTDV